MKEQVIHVFPTVDDRKHNANGGAGDCWCEPTVVARYYDRRGRVRSRVVVHQQLMDVKKRERGAKK